MLLTEKVSTTLAVIWPVHDWVVVVVVSGRCKASNGLLYWILRCSFAASRLAGWLVGWLLSGMVGWARLLLKLFYIYELT